MATPRTTNLNLAQLNVNDTADLQSLVRDFISNLMAPAIGNMQLIDTAFGTLNIAVSDLESEIGLETGSLQSQISGISLQIGDITGTISDLKDQDAALWQAINHIKALGTKIPPGAVATAGDLPTNINDISVTVSINDWMSVSNENAIYSIGAIAGNGDITWGKTVSFETDLSGKADIEDIPTPMSPQEAAAGTSTDTRSVNAVNLHDAARAALSGDITILTQIASRLYEGRDLAQVHQAEIAASPHNGNPWAWIRARIQANNFTGIHVGDFIPMTVSGIGTFLMEIAGINTYFRYGSPEVPRHIDFISRELWPETVQWNLANYNNGIAAMTNPFLASHVNAFLNSLAAEVPNAATADPALTAVDYTAGGILSRLPANVRAVIVPKNAIMERRFSVGILLTENNAWDWRNTGMLWLPTEIEVYGTRQWGGNLSPNQGLSSIGYQQYPIFSGNMKRVKNIVGTLQREHWLLASAKGGNSTHATHITGAGGFTDVFDASSLLLRVPVCFRVT